MKTKRTGLVPCRVSAISVTLLLVSILRLGAADEPSNSYAISERGPNFRVWKKQSIVTNESGFRTNVTSYTELATGLSYWDGTQYRDSQASLEVVPDGAASVRAQHSLHLNANLNTWGAVTLTLPGPEGQGQGQVMRSHVLGLALHDRATGQSEWLAQIQNSDGFLLPPQTVIYPAALGSIADIKYTFSQAGLEQDVVIRTRFPVTPRNPDSTFVEVWTEFVAFPEPQIRESALADGSVDQSLDFGSMRMGRGTAFLLSGADERVAGTRVSKTWLKVDNRTLLIESVPYRAIEADLATLPPPQAAVGRPEKNARLALLQNTPPPLAARDARPMRMAARIDFDRTKALVLDYTIISSGTPNYVFQSDTTYYLSGYGGFSGATVFEGGAIIKVAPTNSAGIHLFSVPFCKSGPFRPVIITARDDQTVGAPITTNAVSGYYANPALGLEGSYAGAIKLHDFRIAYAQVALSVSGSAGHALTNFQVIHSGKGFDGTSIDYSLRNVLLYNLTNVFSGSHTARLENVTLDAATYLNVGNGATLWFTNCLVTSVTNGPAQYNGASNIVLSSSAGVYQTNGAGEHYLAAAYRDSGTTNINASLLADLRRMTTYPPQTWTGVVTIPTLLSQTAVRDTNSLDVGYHFYPIDWIAGSVFVSAPVTLANGAVLAIGNATTNNVHVQLNGGAQFIATGSALTPARITQPTTVQEKPTLLDESWRPLFGEGTNVTTSTVPMVQFRFADLTTVLADQYYFYANSLSSIELTHSQVRGGDIQYGGSNPNAWTKTFAVTNTLFERTAMWLGGNDTQFQLHMRNAHAYGGSVSFSPTNASTAWTVNNSCFDGAYLWQYAAFSNHNNAFISNTIPLLNASNSIPFTNFTYETGPLGFYYQRTNILANKGTNTADTFGLYHFTTTTNQVKETNSITDVGWHAVALNGSGVPFDTDGDGLADHVEDRNGNGTAETNSAPFETNWKISDTDGDGMPDGWEIANGLSPLVNDGNDDPDGDDLTNLQEYNSGTNSTNPQDQWVVRWGTSTPGNIPSGISVAMIGGGINHSVALLSNGLVGAWGDNTHGQTNIPAGLNGITAIAAKAFHNLALRPNKTVTTWGEWFYGPYVSAVVPSTVSDAVGIGAGWDHDLACKSDGTVVAWAAPAKTNELYVLVPPGLSNVTAVAAGRIHSVALKADRTIQAWGYDSLSFRDWHILGVPPSATNVVAIAAGEYHTVALKADGTVLAWGAGASTNGTWFEEKEQSIVPAGSSNLTAIAAGGYNSMALKSDGTIVGWGECKSIIPQGLTNIVVIGAGDGHCFAVKTGRHAPLIVAQLPAEICRLAGSSVTFTITAIARAAMRYQWQYNGANISGATNASLTLNNVQLSNEGTYRVVISNGAGSTTSTGTVLCMVAPPQLVSSTPASPLTLTFGSNTTLQAQFTNAQGNCTLPLAITWVFNGATQYAAVSLNYTISFANSRSAGIYTLYVTNGAGVTNISWTVNVVAEGSPVWWGNMGSQPWNSFTGTVDTIALAVGRHHGLTLRENGKVLAWGTNDFGQTNVASGATNIIAVACGDDHNLVIRGDGQVVAWGRSDSYQTAVPSDATNALAVSAGGHQSLALLNGRRVKQWGQTFASVPANVLSNVTAITSGTNFHLALLTNTTVVGWGANTYGQTNVPAGLTNVVAIAASGAHALALKENGTIVSWGANGSGQTNVPTNLSNVINVAAGYAHSMALRNDGTIVLWGDNTYGQTNAPVWFSNLKLIAAGGNQSAASMDSRFLEYPIDTAKDLLLIYNTNSANSIWVKDYYLAHRPLAGSANVCGVAHSMFSVGSGSTNDFMIENVSMNDFPVNIRAPILDWLAKNPTKRPRYWILFLDVPSRIHSFTNVSWVEGEPNAYNPGGEGNSVSYELSLLPQARSPIITHINMDGTNACRAYIDKLEYFGTNYSPGKLIISARAGGYANTNYYFDDTRELYHCCGPSSAASARDGVVQSGVPLSSVTYSNATNDILANHILVATNVAGYLSWGFHSVLSRDYAVTTNANAVRFYGNSRWFVIETVESQNGQRGRPDQGHFTQWFSEAAFGSSGFTNTPVGAVSHTDEPGHPSDAAKYFGLWASGRRFGACAWESRTTPYFQAIGDPLVRK